MSRSHGDQPVSASRPDATEAIRPSLEQLHARFAEHFPNDIIELVDESHLHAGHAGAAGGAGHFRVRIVSARFAGLRPVARHRLVYDAVADWMPDRVHALTIDAATATDATS